MIGTADEAAVAAKITDAMSCPKGWEWAGQGCSRIAFRSPSGVIYKRMSSAWDYTNAAEFMAARALARKVPPKGWAVPRVDLFVFDKDTAPIIAMEDYGSKQICVSWEDSREASEFFGISDPHSDNIREKDGLLYCIDIGFNKHFDDTVFIPKDDD